jgi:lysophospholipase L1-like esterase
VATLGTVTSSSISASTTAASGTTGPYTNQWYASTTSGFTPGAGNLIAGATGLNLIWTPPDNQLYFIVCQQTDSQSTPQSAVTNQLAASAPLATLPNLYYGNYAGTIKILAVDDSIFHNVPSDGTETPIQRLVDKLTTYLPNAAISSVNAAASGTTTQNWAQAGSTYMSAAISAGVSAGSTDAVVMLGTNDSSAGAAIPAATYAINLQSIASQLFAGISTLQRVWFNNPPYTIPGAASGTWTPQTCDLQRQYGIAIAGIVNGTTLLQGATDSLKYTADHPEETLDEIHPNALGATSYGIRDAYPMLKYFSPATSGRRTAVGFGMALALGLD